MTSAVWLVLLTSYTAPSLAAAAGEVASAQNLPAELKVEDVWQAGSACGPNALYFMLALHNRKVEHKGLLSYLSPPEEGNSLEELREAAHRYGLDVSVVKASRAGMEQFAVPFIAHINLPGRHTGHFVLVLQVKSEGIQVIDGTRGTIATLHPEMFFRHCSGYALVTRTNGLERVLAFIVLGESVVIAVLLGAHLSRWLRRCVVRSGASGAGGV